MNADEAGSIGEAQRLFEEVDLKISLTSISNTFSIIKKLEETKMDIAKAIELVTNVEIAVRTNYDQRYFHKLKSVLTNNKGFSAMKEINSILHGKPVDNMQEVVGALSPADMENLKFAPLVSCDVERGFSQYKQNKLYNREVSNLVT